MSRSFLIATSILSADFTRLGEQVAAAEAGGADWIHVDVMDGHFVPNLTMGPFIVEHVRRITSLPIDVHLMVTNPEQLVEPFARAGATNLTIHVETCPDPALLLQEIRRLGCRAGLTLNPKTSAQALEPHLPLVDLVLVMTVQPGYSGQVFLPKMITKIEQVRRMLDELGSPAWLEVDGGISKETIRKTRAAGADAFVTAHAVFKHPGGIPAGIAALREALAN